MGFLNSTASNKLKAELSRVKVLSEKIRTALKAELHGVRERGSEIPELVLLYVYGCTPEDATLVWMQSRFTTRHSRLSHHYIL